MRIAWIVLAVALPTLVPNARAGDRATEWREDLSSLTAELGRIHPRFADCAFSRDFEKRQMELASRVETLTDEQIVVETQRLLASVGDGHTLLLPFGMKKGALLRLPVSLWAFDDGIYITQSDDARLVGKRVIAVGGVKIDDVMKRLEPFVSHDNSQQLRWATPLYVTFTDFLIAIGATGDRAHAAFTLEGGDVVTLAAGPVDPDKLETKLAAPAAAGSGSYLARGEKPFLSVPMENKVLFVQVNSMSDDKEETLASFGKDLNEQLSVSSGAIVDLRLNNGGEAGKTDELLRALIAADVRGVRLAVLTSRMTFSAAQTFATRIDQWTGAIFVGEATGSKPNHFGNERPIKLSHSGVRAISASGLNQPITAHDDRAAIEPDIPVPMLARDYFAGADPALAAAIAAVSQRNR